MGQKCSDLQISPAPKPRIAHDGSKGCILQDRYFLGKTLAPKVVEVTHRTSGAVYVAYRLKRSLVPCRSLNEAHRVLPKIRSLDFPNICALLEAFEDREYMHLVYSKVSGIPLLQAITRGFSEETITVICYQMARALQRGVEVGICHGAFAPKNVFMVPGDHRLGAAAEHRIEITDFGLAGVLKPLPMTTGPCQSMFYMAPEVVKPWLDQCKVHRSQDRFKVKVEARLAAKPSEATDCWSLGAITFVLLSGRPPFSGSFKTGELATRICTEEPRFGHDMEGSLTREAIQFLGQALQKDQERRPRFAELLKHPWLHLQRGAAATPLDEHIVQHLGTIQAESHFKKAMMRLISSRIPPSKIRDLERAFDAMDLNRNGMVCLREFRFGLATFGLSKDMEDAEISAIFQELDHDGCGQIGFREFVAATIDSQRVIVEELLWDIFQSVDVDGSGVVSREELSSAVKAIESSRLGEEYVKEIVQHIDGEKHDDITFEKFRLLVLDEGSRERVAAAACCCLSPCNMLQLSKPDGIALDETPAEGFFLTVKDKQLQETQSKSN